MTMTAAAADDASENVERNAASPVAGWTVMVLMVAAARAVTARRGPDDCAQIEAGTVAPMVRVVVSARAVAVASRRSGR